MGTQPDLYPSRVAHLSGSLGLAISRPRNPFESLLTTEGSPDCRKSYALSRPYPYPVKAPKGNIRRRMEVAASVRGLGSEASYWRLFPA